MEMDNKSNELPHSYNKYGNEIMSSELQNDFSQIDSKTKLADSIVECLNKTGIATYIKNSMQNNIDSFISSNPKTFDSLSLPTNQIVNSVSYNPNILSDLGIYHDDTRNSILDMTQDMRSAWHQLIILGNGFDLQCGLKSRFSDFFIPREEHLQEIISKTDNNNIEKAREISEAGLTSWDLILFDYKHSLSNDKQQRWCDIERIIENVITDNKIPGIKTCNLIFIELSHIFGENAKSNLLSKFSSNSPKQNDRSNNISVAEYIFANTLDSNKHKYIISDLLRFLLDDLHKLESQFNAYLSGEIARDPKYKEKCDSFFSRIFLDRLPSENDYRLEHSVLDFNYTKPYWYSKPVNEDIDVNNIHGQVNGDIIFGIDGKEYMGDESIVPFTKTYRLLFAQKVPDKQLFYTSNGSFRTETDIIKFYGHSLNKADYSYFQAIFDGVDLYGGKTELIFYYPSDKEGMKRSLANKVTKLMSDYGKTFDNIDHGKNLLHKLLVEGRLLICPI